MNKVKLDGKNNIIDQGYSDLSKYNHSTGKLSDKEKQIIINKVNKQVTYDYYNKPVLKIKATQESDYTADMRKAGPVKHYKKVMIGGKMRYFYTKEQYQKHLKEKPEKKEKAGWLDKFANFFGIKDRVLAIQKVKADYDNNKIEEKHSVSFDSWKNHIAEYFKNKEKWDNFFSGKKEKKEKKKAEKKEKAEKKKSLKKKNGIKLSVMKAVFGVYGGKEQKEEVPVEPVKEPEKIVDEKPEKKDETEEEKKEDKKVAKKINKATPENRNKTEREIVGIPEPTSEKDIVTPTIEFSPKETTVTIPSYKGGGPETFPAKDYTDAIPKDVYLVSEKNILIDERPKYIPEINEDYFESTKYFLPTIKISEDKYIVKTNSKVTRFTKPDPGVVDKEEYTVINRDVLSAMQDYYMKKAKAKQKQYIKELEAETGKKYRKTRISMITERKMTYEQSNFFRSFGIGPHPSSFTESRKILWDKYQEIRSDMKQKMSDMEIQLEEHYNTHAKGRETAYGDKGLKNNLLEDYGVKVKRQNGAEINNIEIEEIKLALDDVFSVFGNRSSMARNSNLKISHSGEKLMHARKAAGLYMPAIKAIGITTKYGQEGTGFILAHEWSHFMDHYLGDKKGRHYVSDDPENIASEIADTFRKSMTKKQKSVYQNRTCECFARAMEQYWAIKTGNKETVLSWDIGNHPTEEVFTERIMPLIDQFFQENDKLLKAIFKIGNKFFRKVK